jgi:hypothetical protein
MLDIFTKTPLDNQILRVEDRACIPFAEGNIDYQNYLKWLDGYELQGREWVKTSNGNTPLPADEPTT